MFYAMRPAVNVTAFTFGIFLRLSTRPMRRLSVTAVLFVLMVAPETYVLAVAIRSVQAILASLQLGDNPVATGNARIENIAIGVATVLVFILLFAPAGWRREPQPVAIS